MVGAIIENIDNNEKIYLYIDNKNIYGYKLISNRINLLDSLTIKKLINAITLQLNDFTDTCNQPIIESIGKSTNYKILKIKNYVIKTTSAFLIFTSIISSGDTTSFKIGEKYFNIYDYQKYNKFDEITKEEVTEALLNNKFIKENNILINNSLFDDILPYYKSLEDKIRIRYIINNFKIEYYDKSDVMYENADGYHNITMPNVIKIKDIKSEDFHIYNHEFIHALQNSHFLYLKEGIAELFTHEYYHDYMTTYEEEIDNLKILIEIVGTDVILSSVFANSDDLLNILKDNLDTESYNKICFILTSSIKDDLDERHEANNELKLILYKLYENIYNEDIKDNSNIFLNDRLLVYKVYFNDRFKERVMHIFEAFRLNLVKFKSISVTYEYVKENGIKNYFYADDIGIYINTLVPATNGVVINGDYVYYKSKDIKYNEKNKTLHK